MRRGILLVAVLFTLAFHFGCGKLVRVDKPRVPKAIDRDAYQGPSFSIAYSLSEFNTDYTEYKKLTRLGDPDSMTSARRLRDSMIDRIRVDIEMNYREYEARLFAGRATGDSIADFLELGLALATTISNGERVKTVLGAVSTAFKGNRLSIDKNFFREKTIETITSKMQATRERVKGRILQNMLDAPVSKYTFEAAWVDLVEFFYAGTLQSGIQALAIDAGADAVTAKAATKDIEQLRLATADELVSAEAIRKEFNNLFNTWKAGQTDRSQAAVDAAKAAVTKARAALKEIDPTVKDDLPEKDVFVKLDELIQNSEGDRSLLVKLMSALKLTTN